MPWLTKEIKNFIYSVENKTKSQSGKEAKARCQLGNKAMKIKLTKCWEERKDRKERKNRYAKLNRGTRRRFIYIKD